MTTIQAPQAVPKRPRLSLKINTFEVSSSPFKKTSLNPINPSPRDPTALNTLSNKYALAMERSPPTQAEPLSAFPSLQSFTCSTPADRRASKPGNKTPFASSFPETPAMSCAPHRLDMSFLNKNSHSTASPPPLSAGAVENSSIRGSSIFMFPSIKDASSPRTSTPVHSLNEPRSHSRRCLAIREAGTSAPYHHPRSLHSILRNSPLPPVTAVPPSPRRQPSRLRDRIAKKVEYNTPLTQDIVTNQYTKSHIDLLMEEASPLTPRPPLELDIPTVTPTFNTEDGGRTPGACVRTGRKFAGADLSSLSPVSNSSSSSTSSSSPPRAIEIGGICKRKKEKKRRWVWTIGVKDEEESDDDEVGGAIAALRARSAARMNTEEALA